MSADHEASLRDIVERYRDLWRVITRDAAGLRPEQDITLFADQVRDALDRRLDMLAGGDANFLAGSFRIEETLHTGVLTELVALRHRDLGTRHVAKRLRPDEAGNVVARALLLREGRFGMMLRHPAIAGAQTVLRGPDGGPVLILPFMASSLSQRLRSGPPLAIGEVGAAMAAILSTLGIIHDAGLVHADISPENLLVPGTELAGIAIADLGISIESGRSHGELDLATAANPAFAPPEQMAGAPLDRRSDLFACGRVGLLLLDHCDGEPGAIEALRSVARELSAAEPDDRPADAGAALARLRSGSEYPT